MDDETKLEMRPMLGIGRVDIIINFESDFMETWHLKLGGLGDNDGGTRLR